MSPPFSVASDGNTRFDNRQRMIDEMNAALAAERQRLSREDAAAASAASSRRRASAATAGAAASGGSGGGGGGTASGTPPLAPDIHNPLTHKLKQVEGLIEEFFDDRDLHLSQKSQGQEPPRTLPALAAYMRRVPVVPAAKKVEQVAVRQKVKTEVKKKSIASVFASLHTKTLDEILLRYDFAVCLLSLAGVLLMMMGAAIGWESRRPACGGEATRTNEDGSSSARLDQIGDHFDNAVITLHWIILITTVCCIAAICNYYRIIVRQKQQEWCRLNGKEIMARSVAYDFLRSRYVFSMILEIVIHLASPTPWYHSSSINDLKYLDLCMFLRLYTVMRLLHHLSPLYRFRHDIVRSNPELKSANFQVRFTDTMKVYFYDYTFTAGFMMWIFCVTVGGFIVWVAERDGNNGINVPYPGIEGLGFCTLLDGIYFMVVSVRTIGYGDLKPITVVGRIVTILFQFFGMSVEALLGSVVINKIAKTKEEKIIDEYLLAFHAWHELRVASAMLIQSTWKTCARYRYLHHKLDKEHMERLLRRRKRHQDFLAKMSISATRFQMPSYEDLTSESKALQIKGVKLRFESDTTELNRLGLNKILMHFADHRGTASEMPPVVGIPSTSAADSASHIYERMPYLRKKEEIVESEELINQCKKMFTSDDVDMARWGRSVTSKEPRGFQPFRKFTATKKVVGTKFGERRVPVGEGHKADIQQEALKFFRKCRQDFKMSIATSSDHVVDSKLLLAYKLLESAARKVKRNNILIKGLRKVAEEQIRAIEELLSLAISGGKEDDL